MVLMADAILAIWDGKSSGTLYTVDFSRKNRKPLTLITVEK